VLDAIDREGERLYLNKDERGRGEKEWKVWR